VIQFRLIHSDERGKLYVIPYGDKEFLLMETKAGYSRGGDYHKSKQHDVVLHGTVQFRFMQGKKVREKVLRQSEKIAFPAEQPHMLTALTDSLVLEWLEGSFEKTHYEPFRRLCK